jgi:hypothetical protein
MIECTAQVLVYERRFLDRHVLIALNMSGSPQVVRIEHFGCEPLLSTYMDGAGDVAGDEVRLRADEGLILRMPPKDIAS